MHSNQRPHTKLLAKLHMKHKQSHQEKTKIAIDNCIAHNPQFEYSHNVHHLQQVSEHLCITIRILVWSITTKYNTHTIITPVPLKYNGALSLANTASSRHSKSSKSSTSSFHCRVSTKGSSASTSSISCRCSAEAGKSDTSHCTPTT